MCQRRRGFDLVLNSVRRLAAEAMLIVVNILRLGESSALQHPIDADSVERMDACLKVRPMQYSVLLWIFLVIPWMHGSGRGQMYPLLEEVHCRPAANFNLAIEGRSRGASFICGVNVQ